METDEEDLEALLDYNSEFSDLEDLECEENLDKLLNSFEDPFQYNDDNINVDSKDSSIEQTDSNEKKEKGGKPVVMTQDFLITKDVPTTTIVSITTQDTMIQAMPTKTRDPSPVSMVAPMSPVRSPKIARDLDNDCVQRPPNKIIKLSDTGRYNHVKPLRTHQRKQFETRIISPWTKSPSPWADSEEGANFSSAPPTEFEDTPTIPFSVRRLSKFTSLRHQPRSELRMLPAPNKTTNNQNNFGSSNGGRFGSKISNDGSVRGNAWSTGINYGSETGNNGSVGGKAWSTGVNYGSETGNNGSVGGKAWSTGVYYGSETGNGSVRGKAWSNGHRVCGNKLNDGSFGSKIGNGGNIVNSGDNAWSNGGSFAGNVSSNLFINRTVNFSTPRSSFGIHLPPPIAVRRTLLSDRFNLNHLK